MLRSMLSSQSINHRIENHFEEKILDQVLKNYLNSVEFTTYSERGINEGITTFHPTYFCFRQIIGKF